MHVQMYIYKDINTCMHMHVSTYIHLYTSNFVCRKRTPLECRRSLYIKLSEYAHSVKDSNVKLSKQPLRNFLDFTRSHFLQLLLVSIDKISLALRSSKESYLKFRLFLDISFFVPLEFCQFVEE